MSPDTIYKIRRYQQLEELFLTVSGTTVQFEIVDQKDDPILIKNKEDWEYLSLPYTRKELAINLLQEYKEMIRNHFMELSELNYAVFYTKGIVNFQGLNFPQLYLIITSQTDPRISESELGGLSVN
jgi:hypothetical protein